MSRSASRALVPLQEVARGSARQARPPLASFLAQLVAGEARGPGSRRTRRASPVEAAHLYAGEPLPGFASLARGLRLERIA